MERVAIVGAGPVGVIAALGLARVGVPVTVVERSPGIVRSPRAAVYHWAVLDGLARLGLLADLLEVGFAKQDYCYQVRATGERIGFDIGVLAGLADHPFNLHLGQDMLVEVALRHLARHPHAELRWGAALTGLAKDADGVTLRLTTDEGEEELRAGWVVGADGGRSAVRGLLGLAFDGFTWPERFVATNVHVDLDAHGFARTQMMIDGVHGAVIVKIAEPDLWRVTYQEDAALPEESFAERLPAHYAALLPDGIAWTLEAAAPYRMHQRSAGRYRAGRVLLAGDAAHVTNPTGGLGLTSGLFDAFHLVPALAAVADGGDPALLDDYDAVRRRIFTERVSPQAIANKRMVFGADDPVRLEEDLVRMRRLATDPAALVERLMFLRALESLPASQPFSRSP